MSKVAQGICWLLLIVSCSFLPAVADTANFAPDNPEYIEWLQNPWPMYTQEGHALGLIPHPVMLPEIEQQPPQPPRAPTSFPTSYDLRSTGKLNAIRAQGTCGSCWAFAAYGSLESALLPSESWDFSENNLKNTHGFDYAHDKGGHHFMSTAYLARWSGPISEEDDPYSASSGISPSGLTPVKRIQDVFFLPDRGIDVTNANFQF